jgi:HSP20 family protein
VRRVHKKKKVDQDEKIEEFSEEVSTSEGMAEGVLKGVGEIIPGLGGLLKGLEKSPAFKERLKKVNQEIERKLKETPLNRAGNKGSYTDSSFSTRPLFNEEELPFGRRVKKSPAAPLQPKEPVVDVFDERDHLRIIAELPGMAENDLKTNLEKDVLTIEINSPGWRPEHKVALPYAPKGKLVKSFRNGILEIKVGKD